VFLQFSTALSLEQDDDEIALQMIEEKETCIPKRHVFFHKKHKSASSTLAAIFKDYSRKHRLIMAKTPVPAFMGGYPAPFDERLVRGLPPNNTKFDIMLHHLRFHKKNLEKVLNDDTIYITSMRNPLSHFVSTFEFFYGRFSSVEKMKTKSDKGQSLTCWGFPFIEFLQGGNKSPNEFIEKMEKVYSTDTPWHFRARNFQSYELGFDSQLAIDADLKTMSRIWNVLSAQFNLIMITEFYWESLILIKDLLCMSWIDLYIDSRTVGSYEKPTFTEAERAKFSSFNGLDEFLYKMSNETFWNKANSRTGGIERLQADVQKLKALYRYCDENLDFCMEAKQLGRPDKDEESEKYSEVKTYDDNFDKYSKLFSNMQEHNGDCPYGFYERFQNFSEKKQRELTQMM